MARRAYVLPPIWRELIQSCRQTVAACYYPGYFAAHELTSSTLETFMKNAARDTGVTGRSRQSLKYAIEHDLNLIKQNASLSALVQCPLWPEGISQKPFFSPAHDIDAIVKFDRSFSSWRDWYLLRLSGKFSFFKERQIALLPVEILAQGVTETNRRVSEILLGRARRPLNRVRAIFLGHGDAGKTSLIHALHGEQVIAGDQAMTRGVNISTRVHSDDAAVNITETREPSNLTVHYWDFGGQVMVHHTHQFFLRSNCLYVIVIDGRRNERASEDARYWLEHVRAYANDAPVLLVGNKVDLAPVHIDTFSLKQLFPNIVDFYPLSCTGASDTYRAEFRRFRRDFFKWLGGPVLTRQALLTTAEHDILHTTQVEAQNAPFLDLSRFRALCDEHHIQAEGGSSDQLLDLFDKLGIVVHFADIPSLDGLLLNPEWLTRAVYEIMYSYTLKAENGYLTRSAASDILSSKDVVDHQGRILRYSDRQVDFVLQSMKRFHLLFSTASDPDNMVVPALLPSEQPDNNFDRTAAYSFRIRFEGFMPAHVLPTLIVDRSQEIYREQVWRFGVRLKAKASRAEAMVQADEHARTLTIWIGGDDAQEYLGVLRDRIYQSLGKMTHLRYFEEIYLPAEAAIGDRFADGSWENYRQIRAALWERRDVAVVSLPFFATNARQYDLLRIRNLLPKTHEKIKILYLASNPMDTTRLDLEEELRAIQRELRSTKLRDRIEFVARFAVRPDDLILYIREEQPHIVHFSGHGSRDGIVLRTDRETALTVNGGALGRFLSGRGVDLLVLSSCYSEDQLRTIGPAVKAIIGTTTTLNDEAALRFAVAFYRSIGAGLSVGEAFRDGKDAATLHGLEDVFVGLGELDLIPLATLDT